MKKHVQYVMQHTFCATVPGLIYHHQLLEQYFYSHVSFNDGDTY